MLDFLEVIFASNLYHTSVTHTKSLLHNLSYIQGQHGIESHITISVTESVAQYEEVLWGIKTL